MTVRVHWVGLAVVVLGGSVLVALLLWPTAYRLGFGLELLSREAPPIERAPQVGATYLMDRAAVWWGAVSSRPTEGWDWLAAMGLAALGILGLIVVLAKAVGTFVLGGLLAGYLAGHRLGAARHRGAQTAALRLVRRFGRLWISELLLVVAVVVAFDAATLALQVASTR
jgi:hypothetical protein